MRIDGRTLVVVAITCIFAGYIVGYDRGVHAAKVEFNAMIDEVNSKYQLVPQLPKLRM